MANRRWTRRKFLEASSGTAALITFVQPAASAVFTAPERETLAAAMDEIIPAADDMPGAGTMGCLDYLERVVAELPGLTEQFRTGLAALDAESRRQSQQPFANLPRTGRVEILGAMERDVAPDFFRTLRDFVYEAYYTRPEIWQRIGYESHLTDHAGPIMKPFDEAVLAQVRTRGKLYRETT
jgi:hypothetical protein